MDIHIPAPRQELTAEQMREHLMRMAPKTLELDRRLAEARDEGGEDRRSA